MQRGWSLLRPSPPCKGGAHCHLSYLDEADTGGSGAAQEAHDGVEDRRRCLHQPRPLQGAASPDLVGPQGEGPNLPAQEVTQGRVDYTLCGQPCGQGIPPDPGGLDPDLAPSGPQDRDPQVSNHPPQESFSWNTQKAAVCEVSPWAVSSGINNIGNKVLLNLEVDPGERKINSLLGVAVCYQSNDYVPSHYV